MSNRQGLGRHSAALLAVGGLLLIAGACDIAWQASQAGAMAQTAPMLRALLVAFAGLTTGALALAALERRRRDSAFDLTRAAQELAAANADAGAARRSRRWRSPRRSSAPFPTPCRRSSPTWRPARRTCSRSWTRRPGP